MDLNQLTQKSQEALQDAQTKALRFGHQEIDVEHLLLALLDQPEGLVPRLLQRIDVDVQAMHQAVEQELGRRPRVTGAGQSQAHLSRALSEVLDQAKQEAERLKDEYVSVEHLLLAIVASRTAAGRLLAERGVTRERFLEVLTEVRGAQRVTSATPEGAYEALEKYGRDLVAEAREGRLDPVIGRDTEIRRVIQIL
jgi:ATP-dependent Clp protease ATP-binding subunit ClpB